MKNDKIVLACAFAAACACGDASAQQPRPKGAAAPSDYLEAVNESAGTVKVEYFPASAERDAGPQAMACLDANQGVRWSVDAAPGGRIRMQAMRGPQCEDRLQVACQREVPRAPGVRLVALRGNCAIVARPAPPGGALKAGADCGPSGAWAPVTIRNEYGAYSIWVTFYRVNQLLPNTIVGAGCWDPNETRMACVEKTDMLVRMEVQCAGYDDFTHRCVVTKSCKGRTICDTGRAWTFQRQYSGGPVRVNTKTNPNGISISNEDGVLCSWKP